MQKTLSNSENERRVISERLDSCQQNLAELRRNNQILQDQVSRLNNELANNEVQKSALESQLRLSQWPADTSVVSSHHEEELMRQLHSVQKEKNELRGKVDSLNNKVKNHYYKLYTLAGCLCAWKAWNFQGILINLEKQEISENFVKRINYLLLKVCSNCFTHPLWPTQHNKSLESRKS